jgi:hypothetical protein
MNTARATNKIKHLRCISGNCPPNFDNVFDNVALNGAASLAHGTAKLVTGHNKAGCCLPALCILLIFDVPGRRCAPGMAGNGRT